MLLYTTCQASTWMTSARFTPYHMVWIPNEATVIILLWLKQNLGRIERIEELSPLNTLLFSWERLSWSLYYDSLMAFHIIDHGKWWLKLRLRCFVNSRPLWYYWRWWIVLLYDAYSSKPIFSYWKFPRFSVDEWSDVDCNTELRRICLSYVNV